MLRVHLWAGLRARAEGQEVIEIDACNTHQILAQLTALYPGLEPAFDAGVSVALDGGMQVASIYADIPDGADVYLMQQLKGG